MSNSIRVIAIVEKALIYCIYNGYMSPKYEMEGRFSEKSDVFRFQVLLLEVTSGRRNSSFNDDKSLSLIGYVSFTLQQDTG